MHPLFFKFGPCSNYACWGTNISQLMEHVTGSGRWGWGAAQALTSSEASLLNIY
jgi:hypothetical protein